MKRTNTIGKAVATVREHYMKVQLAALGALMTFGPCGTALAKNDSSIITNIDSAFNNVSSLVWAVYEGIVLIVGGICLVSVGKELLPAILNAKLRESPEFKSHCRNAVIAVVTTLAFALAPLWVPALFSFFGAGTSGTADSTISWSNSSN